MTTIIATAIFLAVFWLVAMLQGELKNAYQTLADRLIEILLERGTLHVDETPVPQLDPGSGKTKRAYLWAYRSNNLEVCRVGSAFLPTVYEL